MEFLSVDAALIAWNHHLGAKSIMPDGTAVTYEFVIPQSTRGRLGDWLCAGCRTLNFSRREFCMTCRRGRTEDDVDLRLQGSKTVRVGGLSETTSEEDLRAFIATIAIAQNIKIVRDKATQVSKGFGYVTFMSRAEAQGVVDALHNKVPESQHAPVSITLAPERTQQQPSAALDAIAAATAMNRYKSERTGATHAAEEQSGWAPKAFTLDALDSTNKVGSPTSRHQEAHDGIASHENTDTASGFVYDPASGYYYDAATGYYYDANTQLYFHPSTNEWYQHNPQSGEYRVVSQSTNSGHAAADGQQQRCQERSARNAAALSAQQAPSRTAAVIGAEAEYNAQGLMAQVHALDSAAKAAAKSQGNSAKNPVKAAANNTVEEWLRQKEVQRRQSAATTAKRATQSVPNQQPCPPSSSSTPVATASEAQRSEAVTQQVAFQPALGGRVREKVYGTAAPSNRC